MADDFKHRAFRGATFVIATYGLSQAIRLGGNLVLTRLLVPEFFGIIGLAQAFITGLVLFSDIGIGPGIIRSSRGRDPVFLNTAWTLQVIRGLLLWTLTLVLAHPIAKIYNSPLLAWVIPIVGFNAILYGLNSTTIYTLNKDMYFGKLSIMELITKTIALICMVSLAYVYKNIWSLVAGSLVTGLITLVWSHFLDARNKNCFAFEKEAVTELISFGKWIFVSTAMMFLATQADRFLLGKIFPLAMFGVYNIAIIFAELPKQIINQVSDKVIFPLISKFSDLPRKELNQKILQKRKLILVPLALLVALLVCFGDVLIIFLYDDRYKQAGWMLTLLALGMWPLVLYATADKSLYAIGKPKYSAFGNFFKFIYMIICVPVLYNYYGFIGAVSAVAMNDLPVYLVVSIGLSKEKLSCIKQDMFATVLLAAFVGLFITIRIFFEMGIPGKEVFVQ
ncbi:MAG: oligosaccharide flippase family protein [Desulfobulbaceae bacterium]